MERYAPGERPKHYPGDEFARSDTANGVTLEHYELCGLVYAHTTSGQQLVLPSIEHRALTAHREEITCDGPQDTIPAGHLNTAQRQAVAKARQLKSLRENAPTDPFPNLHKLVVDTQGLLWLCFPEEGIRTDENKPHFPVQSARPLADIYVASAIPGYHGFSKYDQADLDRFVPPELQERANAYFFMEAGSGWRIVEEPEPDPPIDDEALDALIQEINARGEFRLAQIRLFEVSTDTSYFPEV